MSRIAFIAVLIFWLAMNALLWRAEYGSHRAGEVVPVHFVWHRMLTAPDSSTMTVFQADRRIGFCQLSTGVNEAMAASNDESPPPKGTNSGGYKIRLDGNVALGEFTNRVQFSVRLQLDEKGQWREWSARIAAYSQWWEIHSLNSEQMVHIRWTADGSSLDHDVPLADLQNPDKLVRELIAGFGGEPIDDLPISALLPHGVSGNIEWKAARERLRIGKELTTVYLLRSNVLERYPISIEVSTSGEILRADLPAGVTATLDEWKP